MRGWISRPISSNTFGVSTTYGGVSVIAHVAVFGIARTYDLSSNALISMLVCLAVVLIALSILETLWMLDLEEEHSG